MEKYIVTLTEEERKTLSDIASKGKQRSQKRISNIVALAISETDYVNIFNLNSHFFV